jgi:hypothetical protein
MTAFGDNSTDHLRPPLAAKVTVSGRELADAAAVSRCTGPVSVLTLVG